ncbi:MAG: S8 family serine peptidase, partial [Bdellovibrionaceae bacterium]|nr:S8 family serine peptidase [Pseudobdellovibrionaceae bacterium]
IIAAARDGWGVNGVSTNVRLLPVQVIGESPAEPVKPLSLSLGPTEEGREGLTRSLGDLVARGVIYAVRSGAKIINFSLGWPQARDSQYMRDIIAWAQQQGVIIVAAAGNDSTQALLRPCAYPGVICVGSHGPDGAPSHFTNFGSGVDLLAPGTNILSTFPMSRRPVRFRSTLGFEFLSGTSQAAPFVAGAVAELLARGVPTSEILPRLISASRPIKEKLPLLSGPAHFSRDEVRSGRQPDEKFFFGGLLDISGSLEVNPTPLLGLTSKEKISVIWDRKSRIIRVPVRLKNLWSDLDVKELSFKLEHLRDSVIRPDIIGFEEMGSKNSFWRTGEERLFQLVFSVPEPEVEKTRIPSENPVRILPMYRRLPLRPLVIESEIIVPVQPEMKDFDISSYPIEGLPQRRLSLLPVESVYDDQTFRRDYLAIAQDRKSWQLWVLAFDGQRYLARGGRKFRILGDENRVREQVIARMDYDLDGEMDYVLGLLDEGDLNKDDSIPEIQFIVFGFNGEIKDQFLFKAEQADIPYEFQWAIVDGVRRPAWVGYGRDPQRKRGLRDRWENPENREKRELRFYWLDREGKLKALPKQGDWKAVDLLEPSLQQKINGEIPVLFARNLGTSAKPSYLFDFARGVFSNTTVVDFRPLISKESYRNFLDTRVDKILNLNIDRDEYAGNFFFGEGIYRQQQLSLVEGPQVEHFALTALRRDVDSALWVRAVFSGKSRKGAFVLTNSEIQYHDLLSGEVVSSSLERYTFFPDMLMTNLYFPTTVTDKDNASEKFPALFTAETSALSRGVRLLVPVFASDGRVQDLVTPARLRLQSVGGCRPLETPVFTEEGHALDYYCGDRIHRVRLKF